MTCASWWNPGSSHNCVSESHRLARWWSNKSVYCITLKSVTWVMNQYWRDSRRDCWRNAMEQQVRTACRRALLCSSYIGEQKLHAREHDHCESWYIVCTLYEHLIVHKAHDVSFVHITCVPSSVRTTTNTSLMPNSNFIYVPGCIYYHSDLLGYVLLKRCIGIHAPLDTSTTGSLHFRAWIHIA